jgi:ABC-2 type transport system ATP-binding protein
VVGVQLQETELPPNLRVDEALELYGSFHAAPEDWRGLRNTLGLSEKAMTRYRELSGGQRQRLSIALAVVGNPRIAILDELTAGLDPAARRETWDPIEEVRGRGVTIELVTHFTTHLLHLYDKPGVRDRASAVAESYRGQLLS